MFGGMQNMHRHVLSKPIATSISQPQQQKKKEIPIPSGQEPNKEEGAQFQWTAGQGIDINDVYPSGRSEN